MPLLSVARRWMTLWTNGPTKRVCHALCDCASASASGHALGSASAHALASASAGGRACMRVVCAGLLHAENESISHESQHTQDSHVVDTLLPFVIVPGSRRVLPLTLHKGNV